MAYVTYVSELEESPSSHKNGEQRADPMVILKSEVRQAGRRAGEQARRPAEVTLCIVVHLTLPYFSLQKPGEVTFIGRLYGVTCTLFTVRKFN